MNIRTRRKLAGLDFTGNLTCFWPVQPSRDELGDVPLLLIPSQQSFRVFLTLAGSVTVRFIRRMSESIAGIVSPMSMNTG